MNKINFFKKAVFSWKRPKIIIVTGGGKACAAEAIYQVLKPYLRVERFTEPLGFSLINKNKILIFETDLSCLKDFEFLVRKSRFPIMVVGAVGEIPSDKNFFTGPEEKIENITKLAKVFPSFGSLVLNFDDETVRRIKGETDAHCLAFGFQETADLGVSDVNLNGGTNFKIVHRGNIMPIWLEKLFGKEHMYSALAAAGAGITLGLNLVEISQALKFYQGLAKKMTLIEGIKKSQILDDSENATLFSMIEALEILGDIKIGKRKIAVLGDVLGIGKYAVEAHEAIGERVAKNADLLFTFGPRAKFIAKGAFERGMLEEKIFQFNTIEEGKIKLQNEIREDDLILVDGSKEMKMSKIIEEIKKV